MGDFETRENHVAAVYADMERRHTNNEICENYIMEDLEWGDFDEPYYMERYIAMGLEEVKRKDISSRVELYMTYAMWWYKRGKFKDEIDDWDYLGERIAWIENNWDVRYDLMPKCFPDEAE